MQNRSNKDKNFDFCVFMVGMEQNGNCVGNEWTVAKQRLHGKRQMQQKTKNKVERRKSNESFFFVEEKD